MISPLFNPLLHPDEGSGSGGFPPPPSPPSGPRRPGSVTFRAQGSQSNAPDDSPLDPANQSLADALRVMLRLLQLAMVILAGLYVFSGMQRVNEGERGIRVLFGKVHEANLEPGFRWSAPFPLGQLIRVNQGFTDVRIDRPYWAFVTPGANGELPPVDSITPQQSLKPDQGGSGSVITGDGNLAHTQWTVGYHADDVTKFTQNVLSTDEERVVRAAVQRAVVQTIASTTISDLLKQSGEQQASVVYRVKQIAQDTLDRMNSGIVIDQLAMERAIPPIIVRADFNRAASAVSEAQRARDQASGEANQTLNTAAGAAARHLIHFIEQYELATAKNDAQAMRANLETIDALLDGRRVEVPVLGLDGRPEMGDDGKPTGRMVTLEGAVSGEVAQRLSEARQYRSGVVSRAQGDLARFNAKLASYQANPLLMIQREWASAVGTFYARPNVQFIMLPKGATTIALQMGPDSTIARAAERAMKEEERRRTEERRKLEMQRQQYNTDTAGLTELPS